MPEFSNPMATQDGTPNTNSEILGITRNSYIRLFGVENRL